MPTQVVAVFGMLLPHVQGSEAHKPPVKMPSRLHMCCPDTAYPCGHEKSQISAGTPEQTVLECSIVKPPVHTSGTHLPPENSPQVPEVSTEQV